MSKGIIVVPEKVMAVGMLRPREGAVKGSDGNYQAADIEVVISLQMGCVRSGALLGPDGSSTGHMIPIGEVSRPLSEVQGDAAARFALREQAAEGKPELAQ